MFHLPPSEGHYQFHPNSINEFCKCFIVSLFQTDRIKKLSKILFSHYLYLSLPDKSFSIDITASGKYFLTISDIFSL